VPKSAKSPRSARRAELGAFLRAMRTRLHPADVGLPEDRDPGRRRTPGLRREEVAQLSGVGVTWYSWLEQGRNILASNQVIEALARALLLDPDERRHLRDLAGLPTTSGDTRVDDVRPRLQRLVDAAAPSIASIYDRHFDYVVWNTAYARLRHNPAAVPDERRNLLWMMFTDEQNRAGMTRWEPAARAVLSQFRAAVGKQTDDPRFVAIVAQLAEASPEFRQWWAEYPVRTFKPATVRIDHPEIGRLDLEVFQLRLVEHPDLLMVVQTPTNEDGLQRVIALLDNSTT